jgi:hypothetical protein
VRQRSNPGTADRQDTTAATPTSDGYALAEAGRQRLGRPRVEIEAALKVRGRAPDDETTKTSETGSKDTAKSNEAKSNEAKSFGRRRRASGEMCRGRQQHVCDLPYLPID